MDDKLISMCFWDKIGVKGYFPISQEKNIHSLLTKAISLVPDNSIVLDIGGNNFSQHTSSRTVYNLLKARSNNFELHIADIVAPAEKLPENVVFHEGDLDIFFSDCSINRINLAVAINVLQEPVNYQQILTSLIERQDKGDIIFIVNPVKFTKKDNIGETLFFLMRGYKPNSFYEREIDEILTSYNIQRKIIEEKKEGPPEPTKQAIEATTDIETAKNLIKGLKTENPRLQEMIDSYLSAINGGSDPVVNYGKFEAITATKL